MMNSENLELLVWIVLLVYNVKYHSSVLPVTVKRFLNATISTDINTVQCQPINQLLSLNIEFFTAPMNADEKPRSKQSIKQSRTEC